MKRLLARCKKNRHGQPADIALELDGRYQEMTAEQEVAEWDILGDASRMSLKDRINGKASRFIN